MKVELLAAKDMHKVKNLISGYAYNDFRHYRMLAKAHLDRYLSKRILNVLNGKDNFVAICARNRKVDGLVVLSFLPWDTCHFGVKIGQLDLMMAEGDYRTSLNIKAALLSFIFDLCQKKGFIHLNCRIDIEDASSSYILQEYQFKIMDVLVTFCFNRHKHKMPVLRTIYKCRKFKKEDAPFLGKIAKSSFRNDRFHLDQNYPRGKADLLYVEWIRNSSLRHPMFVAVSRQKPVGFLTYRPYEELAKIADYKIMGRGLMAIHPLAKGAIVGLMKATFEDVTNHYDCVEYDTRLSNHEVIRLCQRCGLDFVRAKYTFHWWFKDGAPI